MMARTTIEGVREGVRNDQKDEVDEGEWKLEKRDVEMWDGRTRVVRIRGVL